jgi:hypothetical protein
MYVAPEIITIFFIVSFLIYTMPMVLVKFSKTLKGRVLLVMLMIVVTVYNKTGGMMIALLIIFLSEFNYEVNNQVMFEGFENDNAENGENGENAENQNKKDRMTIEEHLTPKSSSSQKVVTINN